MNIDFAAIREQLIGFFVRFPFPGPSANGDDTVKKARRWGYLSGATAGGAAVLVLWLVGVIAF